MESSKEFIKNKIASLEDDLQHYSMVEHDHVRSRLLELEIEQYKMVLNDLNAKEENYDKPTK